MHVLITLIQIQYLSAVAELCVYVCVNQHKLVHKIITMSELGGLWKRYKVLLGWLG